MTKYSKTRYKERCLIVVNMSLTTCATLLRVQGDGGLAPVQLGPRRRQDEAERLDGRVEREVLHDTAGEEDRVGYVVAFCAVEKQRQRMNRVVGARRQQGWREARTSNGCPGAVGPLDADVVDGVVVVGSQCWELA